MHNSLLIVLVNIGTPDDTSVPAVQRYLSEFLSDPRVLTMPAILRWFFVRFVIVPFRAPKSAAAYEKIWTKRGSPLMFHSEDLAAKVQTLFPNDIVRVAMRYGKPSIEDALKDCRTGQPKEMIVVPMFPQFSEAATGSAVAEVKRLTAKYKIEVPVRVAPDFYDQAEFVQAQATLMRATQEKFAPDHVLMSYHGLPESHVQATDKTGRHCLKAKDCCAQITEVNRHCYRAQAFATSRALASVLDYRPDFYSVSFQSRLGRTPWIQPFTDVIIKDLRARGIKRLQVVCPSFVADCLETIEEIGIRCREDWVALGGEDLVLTPCVNAADEFADSVKSMVDAAPLMKRGM